MTLRLEERVERSQYGHDPHMKGVVEWSRIRRSQKNLKNKDSFSILIRWDNW